MNFPPKAIAARKGASLRQSGDQALLQSASTATEKQTRRGHTASPPLVKKDFDKLVDGEASSPARCRASNLRFEPSAVSPRAKPENPKGFQPPCHPLQFLLESFGFRPQKLQRNGFCSGELNVPPQKSSRPRRSRRRGRWLFERAPALSSSPGVFRQPAFFVRACAQSWTERGKSRNKPRGA